MESLTNENRLCKHVMPAASGKNNNTCHAVPRKKPHEARTTKTTTTRTTTTTTTTTTCFGLGSISAIEILRAVPIEDQAATGRLFRLARKEPQKQRVPRIIQHSLHGNLLRRAIGRGSRRSRAASWGSHHFTKLQRKAGDDSCEHASAKLTRANMQVQSCFHTFLLRAAIHARPCLYILFLSTETRSVNGCPYIHK